MTMVQLSPSLARHLAAARVLLVFTLALGLAYPLAMVAIARVPGLSARADGSLLEVDGHVVGSRLIGQAFTRPDGTPDPAYFQSRPSAAGDGYDPTSTGASNLGPEDVVDTPDRPSLLTRVCTRSLAVGRLEGVDGSRPSCTPGGVGAVLGVFHEHGLTGRVTRVVSLNETSGRPFLARYEGVPVELAKPGTDYSRAIVVPVRGPAPTPPEVPADAVTASGSGLDPDISLDYARLQAARIAQVRGVPQARVQELIEQLDRGRSLGFLGASRVNVLELNLALDRRFPVAGS